MSDLLSKLTRALDLVVIEQMAHQGCALAAPAPGWLAAAIGKSDATLFSTLPFLPHVVEQAETAWRTDPDARTELGPFEATLAGHALLLRATALAIDGRRLLVIERLTGSADPRTMLQRAREQSLAHETLARQAADVQAPAADVVREATALAALDLPADARAAVGRLVEAAQALEAIVADLPEPPARGRRMGRPDQRPA